MYVPSSLFVSFLNSKIDLLSPLHIVYSSAIYFKVLQLCFIIVFRCHIFPLLSFLIIISNSFLVFVISTISTAYNKYRYLLLQMLLLYISHYFAITFPASDQLRVMRFLALTNFFNSLIHYHTVILLTDIGVCTIFLFMEL